MFILFDYRRIEQTNDGIKKKVKQNIEFEEKGDIELMSGMVFVQT